MHAQDRANRQPGTLTILSAIFMPVTLLAGIWGMNFENMPASYVPIHLVAFRVLGVGVDTGWMPCRSLRRDNSARGPD